MGFRAEQSGATDPRFGVTAGYIGAAIVGVMLFCMVVFLLGRRYQRKRAARTRTNTTAAPQETASHGAETKVSTDEAVGELKEDV